MTTQTTTVEPETRGLRGVLAMTALTLAVIGTVALWRVPPSGDEPAAAVARSAAQGGATAAAVPAGGRAAEHPADRRARAGDAPSGEPTIYVVESEERAAAIRALGLSPLDAVIWFASVEAEVQFWATNDAEHPRAGGIGVGTAVSDLRLATAPAAEAQITLPSESAAGLVGLTDGRVVVVVVPATPADPLARELDALTAAGLDVPLAP